MGSACRAKLLVLLVIAALTSVKDAASEHTSACKSLLRLRRVQPRQMEAPVTVVMMNWKRPENVKRIAAQLATYAQVQQVLIAMCNPDSAFDVGSSIPSAKVVALDATDLQQQMGVATRFKFCSDLATSELVVTIDDDMLVSEAGLGKLIQAKLAHPGAIVGFYGRNFSGPDPEYSNAEVSGGRAPIGLTKVLLVDRRFCHAFLAAADLVSDLVHASSTVWNGEDIFMSLVSSHVSGEQPVIVRPEGDDVVELQEGFAEGISTRGDHLPHRTRFLRHAIVKLSLCSNQTADVPL